MQELGRDHLWPVRQIPREGGGRGWWSEGHGPTLGGAKFFETSFPHFNTFF